MTNVEALERLAREEGSSNLALRNALLEMIGLYRFIQQRYAEALASNTLNPASRSD